MGRWCFAFVLPLLLLLTVDAVAHARLDHADPGPDTTVAPAPPKVTLSFSEMLEPAFSSITVTNAAGQRVDTGKTDVTGKQMSVPLRSLDRGIYRVIWRVVSVDTHRTEGQFDFRVGE